MELLPAIAKPRSTDILGVPVSLIDLPKAVEIIQGWIERRQSQLVCIRDVHGVMRSQQDPELSRIHKLAGLVTPDGMPLVWVSRLRGHKTVSRVCGADLVAALCDASQETGHRHYFFGGKSGVAERMAEKLRELFPDLVVAGMATPPFGDVSQKEDDAITRSIVEAKPHVIWVGMSTPRQEYWMRDHVARIPGAVLIGVGAAFDFYAGDVKRAPRWMQQTGFEWLHRLAAEPRRLWRRYLYMAPMFVLRIAGDALRHGRV